MHKKNLSFPIIKAETENFSSPQCFPVVSLLAPVSRNRALATWTLLAAWLLSNAKAMEESQSDHQARVLQQAKGQTLCCVNKKAGLLLSRLEGSVSSLGGKTNPVDHSTRTQHRTSIQSMSICFTSPSITLPLHLPVWLHQQLLCLSQWRVSTVSYLGIVTVGNNASSCFGCVLADTLPLCCNLTSVFPVKTLGRPHRAASEVNQIWTWRVSPSSSHRTVTSGLTAQWQVEEQKMLRQFLTFILYEILLILIYFCTV